MSKWVEGNIVNKKIWTDQLFSLQVNAPIEPFRAGQFTKLGIDVDGERISRPYSFVNAPDDKLLEFYFILTPGGILTKLLSQTKTGDKLWVSAKASGFFTLNEVRDAENLWLISTGTALGVYLSLLKTTEPWSRFKNIILVHAVRTADELTYREEIGEFFTKYPTQFQLINYVSRQDTEFAFRDRIPATIIDGRLEQKAGIHLSTTTSQVMLCGNPEMIRDTTNILLDRNFTKNRRKNPGNITTETYW